MAPSRADDSTGDRGVAVAMIRCDSNHSKARTEQEDYRTPGPAW